MWSSHHRPWRRCILLHMRSVRKAVAPTNKVHIPQLTWLSGFTNFMSGPARGVSTLAEPEVVAEPVLTDSSLGRIITQQQ